MNTTTIYNIFLIVIVLTYITNIILRLLNNDEDKKMIEQLKNNISADNELIEAQRITINKYKENNEKLIKTYEKTIETYVDCIEIYKKYINEYINEKVVTFNVNTNNGETYE